MQIRPLTEEDTPALEALLRREAAHNPFHLSSLAEYGLAPASEPRLGPWAIGAFRGPELAGVVMALRGTGGLYHVPGDTETLAALAGVVVDRSTHGSLTLLSGHISQVEPLLVLITPSGIGRPDRCYFRVLQPEDLDMPPRVAGFAAPRLATINDIERLIDFYQIGFYSLAHLPTRSAWRARLSEQLALRSLFFIPDREGRVASAALSSAEGGGAAMIGGVATIGPYRGLGLSGLCVGALCDYLFHRGISTVSLFYLKDNEPAGHVYDKIGFRYDGEWLLAPLGFGASFGPLFGVGNRP